MILFIAVCTTLLAVSIGLVIAFLIAFHIVVTVFFNVLKFVTTVVFIAVNTAFAFALMVSQFL